MMPHAGVGADEEVAGKIPPSDGGRFDRDKKKRKLSLLVPDDNVICIE